MRYLITGGSGWIGGALIDELCRRGHAAEILNIDIRPTALSEQARYWQRCDIMSARDVQSIFAAFQPTHVLHLAATTMVGESVGLTAYRVNTEGTQNVVEAVKATPSVQRLLITSTAYVCRPGYEPKHDEDYSPHSIYGQSKVLSEQITRWAGLSCSWAILRPGTVWGPGARTQHTSFLALLKRGRYWHPGRRPARRAMGYIGNVAFMMRRLSEAPASEVNGRVFYLCDPMTNLYDWANACSRALEGRDVPVLPRSLMWCAAKCGDLLHSMGVYSPLTTFRYRNMTEDFVVPVKNTMDVVGALPYSLESAVQQFVQWYERAFDRLAPMPTEQEMLAEAAAQRRS